MSYFPSNFTLLEPIQSATNLLKEVAADKRIKIVQKLNHNPYVYADQRMVGVILRNLVSNAVKFTNEGGEVTIQVSIEEQFAKITVIDNGVGISEDKANNLFNLAINNVIRGTSGEKGTGFGLVISKNLIEQNGGTISISSRIGEGSEFTFTIPLSMHE